MDQLKKDKMKPTNNKAKTELEKEMKELSVQFEYQSSKEGMIMQLQDFSMTIDQKQLDIWNKQIDGTTQKVAAAEQTDGAAKQTGGAAKQIEVAEQTGGAAEETKNMINKFAKLTIGNDGTDENDETSDQHIEKYIITKETAQLTFGKILEENGGNGVKVDWKGLLGAYFSEDMKNHFRTA